MDISPFSKLLLSRMLSVDITKRPVTHEIIQILENNKNQFPTSAMTAALAPSSIVPVTHNQ